LFLYVFDVFDNDGELFWKYMGNLQGIIIYSLYYMLCICGSIDLAKV